MANFAVIGGLRIDYLISADGRVASGVFGGNAAFAAVGARLWTAPGEVDVIARTGSMFPQAWLQALAEEGVGVGCVVHLNEPVEQRTFFAHRADGARVENNPEAHYRALGLALPPGLIGYTQASSNQDEAVYRPLQVTPDDIPPACWPDRALHISPTDWTSSTRGLAAARAADVPQLTLDPGLWTRLHSFDEIAALIRGCDAFLPSEMEARWMFDDEISRQEMARCLARVGPPVIVLKMGAEGALVYERERDRFVRVPAFPTRVVDVTGAGDAFCGAFAVGLSQTGDPVRAAGYGAVSASFVVEGFGALHLLRASRPAEVERRLCWIEEHKDFLP